MAELSETIQSLSTNKYDFTDVTQIVSLIKNDKVYAQALLDNLIRHTEYLQLHDMTKEIESVYDNVDKSKLIYLDNMLKDRLQGIIHNSLISGILVLVTNVTYTWTKADIKYRLDLPDICATAKNIITPNSTMVYPKEFKGSLFPPQAGVLHRMLEIEANRFQDIAEGFSFQCGILSEIIGFGKTYLSGALLTQPLDVVWETNTKQIPMLVSPVDNPRTINVAIVICNAKAIKEWKANLELCTNLSVMRVNTAKTLNEFTELWNSDKDLPNVLLVKDGTVSGKILLESVRELIGSSVFNRVLVDDYDILNIDKNVILPNACFYWLISSTRNRLNNKKSKRASDFTLCGPSIANFQRIPIILDTLVNVKCLDTFISQEYNVPKIDYYVAEAFSDLEHCDSCTKANTRKCNDCLAKNVNKPDILEIVKRFIYANDMEKTVDFDFRKLLPGSLDEPYTNQPIKALFYNGGVAADLDKSVVLTTKNIRHFESSEFEIALSSGLAGINMPYITHVIVTDLTTEADMEQFIGRAQRIGRTNNLQVLVLTDKVSF